MKNNLEFGIFLVRVIVGSILFLHGIAKFGVFGGHKLNGYVTWLGTLGVPAWLAYASAYLELFSGLFLILGVATQLAALGGIIMMIGAYKLVHAGHGYFMHLDPMGYEYALNIGLLCLAILISGPTFWYLWDPFTRG